MYAFLAFDTEDIYYPPEYGIDDIPGWLGRIMSEVGVTGTFFVMGEKAETLLARGRTDVLEQMKPHTIASHQQGNRYPLLPQVVEGKRWADGMEAVRAYEDWVTEQHVRAFGREPAALSRHNCYFAPQHVALAGERGLGYAYMISQIPESRQPLWYAGAVTFPTAGGSAFAGFDRIYSRDEIFAEKLKQLDAFVTERLEAGSEWACVFACHPVQVMARSWLEHYTLGSGRARTPQELGWHYRTKPAAEEARAQANFRRLCEYLKGHPDIEVVGMDEAARLFSTRPERVDRDALVAYARQLTQHEEIAFHPVFSPGELVCALADGLIGADDGGDLPEEVERRNVLGPVSRPVIAQGVVSVTRDHLVAACRQLVGEVRDTGHLPANVPVAAELLGIGQLALLAGRAYLAEARYDRYQRLAVPRGVRYPRLAHEIDAWVRSNIGDHWAMPLDFSCDALAEQARLQTWTMKPAWLRPPQGPVSQEAFGGRMPIGG